jgi:plasmid stabilization system protein ParE
VDEAPSLAVKLEIAPRAVRDAERAARWWRSNRPAAAALFEDELADSLDRLREAPEVGVVYRAVSGREHRRLFMKATRFHVYYRVVSAELVRVVALWSAQRGRGPRL